MPLWLEISLFVSESSAVSVSDCGTLVVGSGEKCRSRYMPKLSLLMIVSVCLSVCEPVGGNSVSSARQAQSGDITGSGLLGS